MDPEDFGGSANASGTADVGNALRRQLQIAVIGQPATNASMVGNAMASLAAAPQAPPTIGAGQVTRAPPVIGQSVGYNAPAPGNIVAGSTHDEVIGSGAQPPGQAAPQMVANNPLPVTQAPAGSLNGLSPQQLPLALAQRLQSDFGLRPDQAAGAVGNFGHETMGFTKQQEMAPTAGRGGYGIAQWTGPRRVQLENFAKQQGTAPSDLDTQYAFLKQELNGSEKGGLAALRNAQNVNDATASFSSSFLRPGASTIHMGSRLKYANGTYSDLVQRGPVTAGVSDLVNRGTDKYSADDLVQRYGVK